MQLCILDKKKTTFPAKTSFQQMFLVHKNFLELYELKLAESVILVKLSFFFYHIKF